MKPDDFLAMTFIKKYPIDTARLFESMNAQEASQFLTTLPSEPVASVLQHTLPQTSLRILELLPEKKIIEIFSYISATSAVSILSHGEPSWQVGILGKLDTKTHASTLKAFSYPEQSAGRLADPSVLVFTADRTVSDAILWVQKQPDHETDDMFILNRQQHLVGKVPMRSLLITDPDIRIEKVMIPNLDSLSADLSLEEIRHSPYWQTSSTLPVIDSTQAFLGVIRYHTVLATAKTEDVPKKQHSHSDEHQHLPNKPVKAEKETSQYTASIKPGQTPSLNL